MRPQKRGYNQLVEIIRIYAAESVAAVKRLLGLAGEAFRIFFRALTR